MKIHAIFAQRKCLYPGEYNPELVDAVDEYSFYENPGYIHEKLVNAENDTEFVSVAMFEIDLGEEAVKAIDDRLNQMVKVEGTLKPSK